MKRCRLYELCTLIVGRRSTADSPKSNGVPENDLGIAEMIASTIQSQALSLYTGDDVPQNEKI